MGACHDGLGVVGASLSLLRVCDHLCPVLFLRGSAGAGVGACSPFRWLWFSIYLHFSASFALWPAPRHSSIMTAS
jgi:hypothetical protein